MIVQSVDIHRIKPATYNPRKDLQPGDADYKRLERSIDKWDMVEPLVWNRRSGNLVGGHQRLKILKARGDTEVDVSVVDLGEQDEAALNVALNKIGGDWDMSQLSDVLSELDVGGFDATLTGFDGDELENALTWTPDGEVVEDTPPEPPKEAVSKLGEIYELGRHRVMCGDATDGDAVVLVLGGEIVGCIVTDPPYGMALDADFSGMKNKLEFAQKKGIKSGRKYDKVTNDDRPFDPEPVRREWGNPEDQLWFGADYYSDRLNTIDGGAWLVWDKRVDESADRMFGSCFELVWSARKRRREILRHKWAGIFGTEKEPQRGREHPTQKPVVLMVDLLGRTEGLVADPFLGSGTTLIAAEQLGRVCYGMEIEPRYVDVIRQRYANFVKDPQFSPTGELTNGKAKEKVDAGSRT